MKIHYLEEESFPFLAGWEGSFCAGTRAGGSTTATFVEDLIPKSARMPAELILVIGTAADSRICWRTSDISTTSLSPRRDPSAWVRDCSLVQMPT